MQNKITVFYDHILNAAKQQNTTTKKIANEITSCGISGVEMDYYMLKESGDALATDLQSFGLPINSCYCFFDWAQNSEDKSYVEVLEHLKRLEISNILVVPGFIQKSIVQSGDKDAINVALSRAREAMIPNMIHFLDLSSNLGINVFMEDFDDITAPFATIEQLEWFLERFPSLKLAFDTGNFLYSKQDVTEAYNRLKKHIEYVHCKDRSFTVVEGEESKATIAGRDMYSAPVGSGVIPMSNILKELKTSGYSGTIAIEHFGSLDQLRDMKASASYLKYF